MHRVLIAGGDSDFHKSMLKHLEKDFMVLIVEDGMDVLGAIYKFDPHILCIDMQMQESDSIAVVRTVRTSGKNLPIIAIVDSCYGEPYAAVHKLAIDHILLKPFLYSYLGGVIKALDEAVGSGVRNLLHLENEVDQVLSDLGFRMGTERYRMIRYVLLLKCRKEREDVLLKELYLDVAKELKSCYSRIEKAVREAIKAAWRSGNRSYWQAYFSGGAERCPTSEEFITVIAHCLAKKGRLHREILM